MKLFFRTLFTTLFFPWQVQTYAKNLRITTQDWPPYQISKGSQITGSATKTVECVLNKLNIAYNIEVLPWKTAQETVKAGKADAFYAAGITTERNTYAVPTEKIANYKWVWVLNKNSILNPLTPEFKKNINVSAKFGTGPEFYLFENNYKIIASPKELTQLFKMLKAKRFEAFLTPEEPLTDIFDKKIIDKNDYKFIFHSDNALVFYFSKIYVKSNPKIIQNFNQALKNCEIK